MTEPLETKIARLKAECSHDNWDLDRSRAVPEELWATVREIHAATAGLGPEPLIFPGDASIHFDWNLTGSGRLVLELYGDRAWIADKVPGGEVCMHKQTSIPESIEEIQAWLTKFAKGS